MPTERSLAIFDFDHTITRSDTLLAFIQYVKGKKALLIGFIKLLPTLVLYKMHILPNQQAKEKVLTYFFGGMNAQDFVRWGNQFQQHVLPKLLRKQALEAIKQHKQRGDEIIVITASCKEWVEEWCSQQGIMCISTQLDIQNQKITGKIDGNNCYGEEKLLRLKKIRNLNDYSEIHVYGDSKGDFALLKIATHPHFKKFE
ncbi:MAG: HAD-IB family hydrolase [Thermoflavifilum sp.]|nr:HAD-IB family hydrolase [Thermoflavifilum sp.]